MTKEDIARVATGAPALHRVVVLTLPDCLLLRQWSRAADQEGDAAAAHLGATFRAAADALRALGAGGPTSVTIERDDTIVIVQRLGEDAAAGFVFDRTAPLGLVRMQVRQLGEHLSTLVPGIRDSLDLPRPEAVADLPSVEPSNPTIVMPPVAPAPRAPAPPPPPPPVSPRATQPAITPVSRDLPPPPAAAPAPTPSAKPRAVRLLEFFRRYAPDPHASMLRLSLRTGISVEVLDRPEQLDEGQVDAIAAAVSDILGQEQVGV